MPRVASTASSPARSLAVRRRAQRGDVRRAEPAQLRLGARRGPRGQELAPPGDHAAGQHHHQQRRQRGAQRGEVLARENAAAITSASSSAWAMISRAGEHPERGQRDQERARRARVFEQPRVDRASSAVRHKRVPPWTRVSLPRRQRASLRGAGWPTARGRGPLDLESENGRSVHGLTPSGRQACREAVDGARPRSAREGRDRVTDQLGSDDQADDAHDRRVLARHPIVQLPPRNAGPFTRPFGVASISTTAMIGTGLRATPTANAIT